MNANVKAICEDVSKDPKEKILDLRLMQATLNERFEANGWEGTTEEVEVWYLLDKLLNRTKDSIGRR